jgi:hypothetical protein
MEEDDFLEGANVLERGEASERMEQDFQSNDNEYDMDTPNLVRMDIDMGGRDAALHREDNDMGMEDEDMDRRGKDSSSMLATNGGHVVGEDCNAAYGRLDSNKKLLLQKLIKIQSIFYSSGLSQGVQQKLLAEVFGGLEEHDGTHVLPSEHAFGDVFRDMPPTWKGEVEGNTIPLSWRNLMNLYRNLGMLLPQRWRMCVGRTDFVHEPRIIKPVDYDNYDRVSNRMCSCIPKKILRECPRCLDTCTDCGTIRKDMIPIDYSLIAPQLCLLIRSQIFCEKMITLWENRGRWMNKDVEEGLDHIKDIWDGKKMHEYQVLAIEHGVGF